MGGSLRPFARGFLDVFKATSGTVFAGDPNADASDVSKGIIRTSGSVALGAGAAGAAGGGGFFGNTGGLTSSAGGVGATGSVGSAGATIPFTTAVPGSAVSAGTSGAGFFGGSGALGLSSPGGITQTQSSSNSFLNRDNIERAVNQARRQRGNQRDQQEAPNAARNQFLDQRDAALFRAAGTGDPGTIAATGILGGGMLFGRALQDSLGSPDPRELQARLVQEAALEASASDAIPGTPEYTQAITQAFASRGLGTESLAAQAQGKQLEREQSKQSLEFARLDQLRAQTRQLQAASLGDGGLSLEELKKTEEGKRAVNRGEIEVRQLNRQRVSEGLPPMSPEERRAETKLRASYYFDQLAKQGKSGTAFNPATGVTTTTQSQPNPIIPYDQVRAQTGEEPAVVSQQQEARETLAASQRKSEAFQRNIQRGTPPDAAFVAAKAEAALHPTVENPTSPPASINNRMRFAEKGRTTLRPNVREKPTGTNERDERRKAARALESELNAGISGLNRLVGAVNKFGARRSRTFNAGPFGSFDLSTVGENLALLATDLRPTLPGVRKRILEDSAKRLELQGTYAKEINSIVKAQKGVATDADVERFEKELLNPGSEEAQLLEQNGTLIEAYVKHYKAILDRAQDEYGSIQSDNPIRLNEIHPAIRRILQKELR